MNSIQKKAIVALVGLLILLVLLLVLLIVLPKQQSSTESASLKELWASGIRVPAKVHSIVQRQQSFKSGRFGPKRTKTVTVYNYRFRTLDFELIGTQNVIMKQQQLLKQGDQIVVVYDPKSIENSGQGAVFYEVNRLAELVGAAPEPSRLKPSAGALHPDGRPSGIQLGNFLGLEAVPDSVANLFHFPTSQYNPVSLRSQIEGCVQSDLFTALSPIERAKLKSVLIALFDASLDVENNTIRLLRYCGAGIFSNFDVVPKEAASVLVELLVSAPNPPVVAAMLNIARQTPVLPTKKIISVIPRIKKYRDADWAIKQLLLSVPVNDYSLVHNTFFRTKDPFIEELMLRILAKSPLPDPRVAERIRSIVGKANMGSNKKTVNAALIALPNFFSPLESMEVLQPLLEKGSSETILVYLALSKLESTKGFEPLYLAAYTGLDSTNYADCTNRLEILLLFPKLLLQSFSKVVEKIFAAPVFKKNSELEALLFNSASACKRMPTPLPAAKVCRADFAGFANSCLGPKKVYSVRVTKLVSFAQQRLKQLLAQLQQLAKSEVPQIRHFVLLVLEDLEKDLPRVSSIRRRLLNDSSVWLQATAIKQMLKKEDASALKKELSELSSRIEEENCLSVSSSEGYSFRRRFNSVIKSIEETTGARPRCRSGACA